MKKIGIMGGTFNPPHKGHFMMAKKAKEKFLLEKVLFVPTGDVVYKDNSDIINENHRYNMTKLMISGEKDFLISDVEITSNAPSRTAVTLNKLKCRFKDSLLYFILGADSLDYIEKWYQPEEIFKNSIILAFDRNTVSHKAQLDKVKFLKQKYGGDIKLISGFDYDISSSEIRRMIKNKDEDLIKYLDEDVYGYIKKNNLYTD